MSREARTRRGWRFGVGVIVSVLLCVLVLPGVAAAAVYPLKVSPNGRYLIDQQNVPFLLAGDSPQSLIVNLSEADAEFYFANRAALGFNTVWINLLCVEYTGGRANGSTYDGIVPFTTPGDLATPNEAYFVRADSMIRLAAKYGLLVVLDPAETGGWINVLRSNGVTKARAYGQYLGNRYQSFDNILWMSGNDYGDWSYPGNDPVVQAVALGIRDVDTRHIHTVQLGMGSPPYSAFDDPSWLPMIEVSSSYTYRATYADVLAQYSQSNYKPVLMVEANYDFEGYFEPVTPKVLRLQDYWTMLSGAAGQIYGNRYTWTLPSDWKTHLDTQGATQLGHLSSLFLQYRWYDLVPDRNHELVTAGYGTFISVYPFGNNDYVTAARVTDGSLAIAYLPKFNNITVDMSKMAGPVTAFWYDPSSGHSFWITGPYNGTFLNSGFQNFRPTGNNSDGDSDWVLVLTAGTSQPPSSFTLTVTTVGVGTGNGTVTSSPAGISCGAICSASFNNGTDVTLTATPATGSTFTGWSGSCSGTGTCIVSMTQAGSVTATFAAGAQPPPSTAYTLTVAMAGSGSGTVISTPSGIDCGSTCSTSYASGSAVTLTATPAAGTTFTGWGRACPGTGPCTLSMSRARSVTATFALIAPTTYTLTLTKSGTGVGTVGSVPAGIACGTACSASFPDGTSVTLTAFSAIGSTFTGWSGAECPGTGGCTVTANGDMSVAATFATQTNALTVTKAGSGSGTVTSNPSGITCGATCSTTYNYNTGVTLTAAPATGSTFIGWSGACAGTGPCTLSMTQARSVTATFTPQTTVTTYPIAVTKTGSGSGTVMSAPSGIDCGSTCSANLASGTDVTLTAAPAIGSTFIGWTGAGCTGTGRCSVTMNAAESVTASFTLNPIGTESGLIAAYAFDEGSGTTVVDASGNSHTGTLNGATWSTSGKFGGALSLDGMSARVTVPSSADLNVTSGFTLMAWVYPTAAQSNWRTVLHKETDRYYLMASSDQNTPASGGTFVAGNENTYGPTALPVNTWSHLAATYDGNVVRLFVNGTQVASQAQTTPLTISTGPLSIGGTAAYGEYFQGTIDEVRVYNRALSASELQADMNTPLGGSTPLPTTSTLTVTKSGSGVGTVGSAPAGITCGTTCSASFPEGTQVTLTAFEAIGSTFAGWSGAECPETGDCTVTVTGAMSVTATFTAAAPPPSSTSTRFREGWRSRHR